MLTREQLIKMYFDFFKAKGHKVIPSASLIPENDPSVLFITAGMHPLVPYLLGEEHPSGKKLVCVQKCIRTSDIDEVGDASHLTFFEMLGNWSLGDYFKSDAIKWSLEFLTDKKYLNIPIDRLSFSVFKGEGNIPKDTETYRWWRNVGIKKDKLFYLDKKHNFWELGTGSGPCGPDTEMFFELEQGKCGPKCNPSCDCGRYLEIWNDVFMEYELKDGKYLPLKQKNVDTGMGLERVLSALNNAESVYDTELFDNSKKELEKLTNKLYIENRTKFRIIMDHMRTSTFILGDEKHLTPNNVGAGYVLRRLIRRSIRYIKLLGVEDFILDKLAVVVINDYKKAYPELEKNKDFIINELKKEEERFNKTIRSGTKMFNKIIKNLEGKEIPGESAFKLFDTFGFPIEMTKEMAKEQGLEVDIDGFEEKFKEHQELSRTAAKGDFKGGLADTSKESIRYHTLAHIVLSVLKEMYGKDTIQKGANITPERLRFDFNLDHKMDSVEKEYLTTRVNEIIKKKIDVTKEIMSYEEAKKQGAEGIFNDKYGSEVSVYTIEGISKEICGGPHVKNIGELGTFGIIKEESSSAGVRRLKCVLVED